MTASAAGNSPRGTRLVGPDETLRSVASAMVDSMPFERRAVFALAITQRLSYPQIAVRLGLAEDAIKFHIRDGLASVRRDVLAQLAVLGGPVPSPVPPERVDGTVVASS